MKLELLDAPIPRSAIASRPGGSGKTLSYLEGWYVINRLNEIYGNGKWSYEMTELRLVDTTPVIDRYGKEKFTAHYIATVSLNVPTVEKLKDWRSFSTFTDVGYGNGSDAKSPGAAHELAVKEAVTDGLKRCAKNLGLSLGLALYDKTQENVVEDEDQDATPTTKAKPSKETKSDVTKENILKSISATARVLISKGQTSKEDLVKTLLSKYSVNDKSELSKDQALEFLDSLKSQLK